MQSNAIFLYSDARRSGTRIVALGLMAMLKREVADVAYFKPIITKPVEEERDIDFFKHYFKLRQPVESAYGLHIDEVQKLIAEDRLGEVYERILERYHALEGAYDVILCEGIEDDFDFEQVLDFDIDLEIAASLAIPMIAIVNAKKTENLETLEQHLKLLERTFAKHRLHLLSFVVNRLDVSFVKASQKVLQTEAPLFVLPEMAELNQPTIAEIMEQTGATLISKDEKMLDRSVAQSIVGAMTLEHYLNYLKDGDLIIVPGDRSDILVGTYWANLSRKNPSIAGMLLTGGLVPAESIMQLLSGVDFPALPMIGLHEDTQAAALKVQAVQSEITLKSERKISLAEGLFCEHVDLDIIKKRLTLSRPETMTPVRFTYMLYEKARHSGSDVLLPEIDDERVLRAAEIVLRRKLCKITLLGNPEKIAQRASLLGLNLSGARIVDPENFPDMDKFVETFYQLRKHKGIILPMAKEMMSRVSYFATMMVHLGYADALVSGATHTTRETIKPAFEIIKMEPEEKLISSVFFMLLHDRVLVYGDCAVNPDPNAEALAEIAIQSAHTAQAFGLVPRVAMLSYSSGDSGVGEDVDKVRKAMEIAKQRAPELLIEGPMQYDAAIDPKVAKEKMPGSKVAGQATVFIFPDLNTGNNTYKAVQRSAGAIAIGPILQGIRKPVNDLSRGCLVEDIVHTIAITAVQAAMEKAKQKS